MNKDKDAGSPDIVRYFLANGIPNQPVIESSTMKYKCADCGIDLNEDFEKFSLLKPHETITTGDTKLTPELESIEDTEKQFLDAGRKLLAKAKTIEYKLIKKIHENENKFKCHDCGTEINEGEFKTFGICDSCWDKFYEKNKYRSDIQLTRRIFSGTAEEILDSLQSTDDAYYHHSQIAPVIELLRDQLKEKDEIITALKNAMKKGNELYAKLKFDDEPFTPYQLALQEIESLKEQLSQPIYLYQKLMSSAEREKILTDDVNLLVDQLKQQEAVFREATRVQYEDFQGRLMEMMDKEKFLSGHVNDLI